MPEIETSRLLMRAFRKEDADEHLRVVSDEEFRRYFPPPPVFQPTRDSVLVGIGRFVEHWHQFGFGVWALELRGEGRLAGYCGLRHLVPTDEIELLYGLDRALWGRGLATEAARASLRYGFEQMRFARVMAVAHPQNAGSRRVLEKCGLRYERDAVYFDMNCAYYAIERADFRADDAPYAPRP
ncbi:MAG TPA: GNAT family N-acetyltransferase [Pyrinomonadaceae bacterium]|nr:GNAT family N-acetyltransferase [Pyrinomonadaceae bacterium]